MRFIYDHCGKILIGLLVVCFVGMYYDQKNVCRLMQECLKDHKEYECYAMLRRPHRGNSYVPTPVIIPR